MCEGFGVVVMVGWEDELYNVALLCSASFWRHRIVQRHGFDLRMSESSHTLLPIGCGRAKGKLN